MRIVKFPKLSSELESIPFKTTNNKHFVTFYDGGVQAGFPSPAEDFKEHQLSLDEKYLNNPDATFIIKVVGNSMYPKINDGDFVIVEHQITFDENKVCLVLADGDPRIKQVMTLDNRHVALKSFNDEFETQILKSSDVQILGIVRKVVSEI